MVVCDELGSGEELLEVERGVQGGVNFLCSVHAGSLSELEARLQRSRTQLRTVFSTYILLEGAQRVGRIRELSDL